MIISLDTETTGLDFYHGARPYLVTLCDEKGNNTWWQWNVDPKTREVHADPKDLREINDFLTEADEIVLQNAKFDYQGLRLLIDGKQGRPKLWWNWDKVHDTLLAGHLLASNQPHDLTTMALVYLGVNVQPFEDRMKAACLEARKFIKRQGLAWRLAKVDEPDMPSAKETTWKYDTWMLKQIADSFRGKVPKEWEHLTSDYANSDSLVTIKLFLRQREFLKELELWQIYIERLKLLPVISAMEVHGVSINRARVLSLEEQYTISSKERHDLCLGIAEGALDKLPKNGSSNALKEVLFGKFGLKTAKRTKKGNVSLDKHVLEEWAESLPHTSLPYVFIRALQGYRKRQTALGYIASYKRFWLPTKAKDQYLLHPSINPTGTATLRMSSSNPNEQQISKYEIAELGEKGHNARYMFGPAPGREWWSCDAKNIELRLPAYESGEKELIELFEHPEEPPYYGSVHLLNFHTVYPDIWEKELREVGIEKVGPHCKEKYDSTWYQWCKNGDFAVQYGAIERTDVTGTADKAFHRVGSHAKLKSRFSKLEKLNAKWIRFAERHGYVETMPDKTVDPKRGYPLYCSRTRHGGVLPTVPLNYHIQGSAMWWMCKAMVRCFDFIKDRNRGRKPEFHIHLVMQIHDELIFDFPKSSKDPREKLEGFDKLRTNLPVVRALQELMKKGGDDYGIPTPVSCKYHPNNWGEGFSL